MASYQQLRHHSRAPYESPAKIFAQLKSKVQREMVDGVFDEESRVAGFNGVLRTPKGRTSEDAIQHEMIFGHGEVTALTLSPIPSPRKTNTCMPDGERSHCDGAEQALKHPHAPRQRPFMESTTVCDLTTTRQSGMDGFHTNAWLADRLVHLEEAPRSVFSPTRLRKRKLDEQLCKTNNMFSDMDYVHCQEKERKSGHGFSGDDHYTHMGHVDPAAMKHTGCAVDTTPCHPATPAKIFAYLKEKENQRDQCDVQKVTSSTPDNEWDHQSEEREEPDCAVSRVNRLQSLDLDEDVRHDLVLTVPPQPVVHEDPLLLLSPRVSIPKLQQAVFQSKKWPKGITFPSENMIHLQKWFIRCSRTGLFLDGIRRDNNIPWNSNVVTERVSKTVLKTITGRIYNLVGKMNLDAPSQFPKWFVKSFANGFPSNWKDIYENYLSESNGLKRSKTQSEKRSQNPRASTDQSLQQQQPRKSRKTSKSSPSSTAPSLQVSRSGRIIKPPLDYWRGGRVILDADMNVTIHDGYDTIIQAKVTPSITKVSSVSTMLAKNPALVKVSVNNDCEPQESVPQSPLQRKVKALQRKRHKTKANVIEKPPSPVNHSPTERATRSSLRQRAKDKTSKEAEPQESMYTKENKQKVSKAKPGKASQPPASSQPPVVTGSSSQPLSRRREKENIWKKTGSKSTEKKSQVNLPRRSSRSSNSSLERESRSQKSQKKTNQKPRSKTPSPQPAQITTRATAQSNRTRKRTARNKQSSGLDGDAWTEEELRKLQEAVSCHPQHVTGYWTKVAMMVGTRSADECHKRYTCQWASKSPTKRESKAKPKAPSKEKVDNPLISARVGTLRRKQQVRDFLEGMAKDDMDDVFSSAYMQNKRFEVPSMCPSDDHDFSMTDQEPLTPRHTGFPEAKTPQCLHITPNMMGSSSRNYDDKYVFQLQKRMKNRYQFNVQKHAPKTFSPTASVKKTMKKCANTENDTFVVWEMFPDKEAHSSEEEDFYFSEND